jgi:hypothetical protein
MFLPEWVEWIIAYHKEIESATGYLISGFTVVFCLYRLGKYKGVRK